MPLSRAWSFDLITGRLLAELPLIDGDSFSIEPNRASSLQAKLDTEAMLKIPPRQWRFPWAGVVFVWESPDGSLTPVEGGPVTGAPVFDIAEDTLTLPVASMWTMLDQRIVVGGRDFGPGHESELVRANASASGLSLGSIAEMVVHWAMAKPNGSLPIVFDPSLWEDGLPGDGHQRTYEAFNLGNNMAGKLLTELCEVIGGPDIVFRPRLTDDGERIEFLMLHGTDAQPAIRTERASLFDLTAEESPISQFTVHRTEGSQLTRVYSTGAGEGEGLLVSIAEHDARIQDGAPMREAVTAYQSVTTPDVLARHAASDVRGGDLADVQVDLVVDGDDPFQPFGTFQLGETVSLVCEGLLDVPDGSHLMKITKLGFTVGSPLVAVSLQEGHP